MDNWRKPDWDHYFMEIAETVAKRGTCDRAQVGAIIVSNKRIIASGYNGSLPGLTECCDVGHDMEDGHCVRTVHSELNAIAQAARMGHATEGAAIYCTHMPCWNCTKAIISAGIQEIVYKIAYRPELNTRTTDSCRDCQVNLRQLKD